MRNRTKFGQHVLGQNYQVDTSAIDQALAEAAKDLPKLDRIRQEHFQFVKKVLWGIAGVWVALLITMNFVKLPSDLVVAIFMLVFVVSGLALAALSTRSSKYDHTFVNQVLEPFISQAVPNFNFHNSGGFRSQHLEAVGFLGTSWDSYHSRHQLIGTIEGQGADAAHVHITETKGSGKNRRRVVIFSGTVLRVEIPVEISANIRVLTDHWESIAGDLIGNMINHVTGAFQQGGRSLVKIAHPEFEEKYKVHSHEPSEAEAIITPEFADILLDLRDHFGDRTRFAIYENHFYVSVPQLKVIDVTTSLFSPVTIEQLTNWMREPAHIIKQLHIAREAAKQIGDAKEKSKYSVSFQPSPDR